MTTAVYEANCYRLLGLDARAPLSDVRRAYRRLARALHPDLNPGSEERFKEITAAYNVLTGRCAPPKPARKPRAARRPAQRAERTAQREEKVDHEAAWDAWRRRARGVRPTPPPAAEPPPFDAQRAEPPAADSSRAARPQPETVHPEVEQPEARSPWFERLRERLRRVAVGNTVEKVGQDVTLRLPLSLEAVLHGKREHIAIQRSVACECDGEAGAGCVCGGIGRVTRREKVRVVVPAGARPGTRLRLAGKGSEGLGGEANGDLYLLLEPEEIEGFRREGADLHGNIAVSRAVANRGGAVRVKSPHGDLRLVVPPGTRGGERFRLRNQGLPRWNEAGRGSLYLVVEVV